MCSLKGIVPDAFIHPLIPRMHVFSAFQVRSVSELSTPASKANRKPWLGGVRKQLPDKAVAGLHNN